MLQDCFPVILFLSLWRHNLKIIFITGFSHSHAFKPITLVDGTGIPPFQFA